MNKAIWFSTSNPTVKQIEAAKDVDLKLLPSKMEN